MVCERRKDHIDTCWGKKNGWRIWKEGNLSIHVVSGWDTWIGTLRSSQWYLYNPPRALYQQRRLIIVQSGKEEEHPEGQLDDSKGVTEVGNWKISISEDWENSPLVRQSPLGNSAQTKWKTNGWPWGGVISDTPEQFRRGSSHMRMNKG